MDEALADPRASLRNRFAASGELSLGQRSYDGMGRRFPRRCDPARRKSKKINGTQLSEELTFAADWVYLLKASSVRVSRRVFRGYLD
jgi:hypothetical protein